MPFGSRISLIKFRTSSKATILRPASWSSRFSYISSGVTVACEILTFASREDPTLVCQEVALVADAACDLQVKAIVDGSGISGRALRHSRETPGESEPACDGTLLWESAGGVGKVGLAYVTEMKGGQATRVEANDRRLQAIDLKAPMPSAPRRDNDTA